jgi:hypothetical protein
MSVHQTYRRVETLFSVANQSSFAQWMEMEKQELSLNCTHYLRPIARMLFVCNMNASDWNH